MNAKPINTSNQRRRITKLLALSVLAGIGYVGAVQAETYPSKPITLVVPYLASSANDMLSRLIGQKNVRSLGSATHY